MKKTFIALLALFLATGFILKLSGKAGNKFHTDKEIAKFRNQMRITGPHTTNDLFGGSGICQGCHGHDPNGLAFITPWGEDVNVYDDWAATMMANSAKDPMWRAKVSHEILVNPALQTAIETKCTSCHAPMGHFNAFHNGATSYSIASMITDSIALDGVSCGACHQQKDTLIGKRFSGHLIYDTNRTVYGPYMSPFSGPMESFIGFKVEYGKHVTKAGFCAGCHTLITDTYDLSGTPTGTTFVEQATYHEWLNSSYNDEIFTTTGRSCQSCHLPRIDEDIVIAGNFAFLGPRRPFGEHHLVGANSFMLKLIKNNKAALGVTANDWNFDSTIAETNSMLRDSSVKMELFLQSRTADTVYYDLKLTNLAGHKFPSGYPSRRAFVQFVLLDATGDTLFKNGMLNSAHELIGQDATYEPHHNVINNPNDVQIYEMVAGDVNGDVTTLLLRMHSALKDNRLTPKGFTTSHSAYDTVKIVGGAATDTDFNYDGFGVEGSGSDIIHFKIPLAGYTGNLNVMAALYYQSIPHRFLNEMFSHSSSEINSFQTMFNAADQTPALVAQIKEGDLFLSSPTVNANRPSVVYPNPTTNGIVKVKGMQPDEIIVYTLTGAKELHLKNTDQFTLQRRGTYIVVVRSGNAQKVEKLIYR